MAFGVNDEKYRWENLQVSLFFRTFVVVISTVDSTLANNL